MRLFLCIFSILSSESMATISQPNCVRQFSNRLRGGFQYYTDDGFRQTIPTKLAIMRIKGEISALESDPPTFFRASPLDNDLLNWHFVLCGANDTVFENGLYHGQILLDQDYPMKPPRILFLTDSGRFEVGVPICLSITSHHQETWQPAWDIRICLTALQSFMESPSMGAIGGLDAPSEVCRLLAARSLPVPHQLSSLKGADYAESLRLHQRLHRELASSLGLVIQKQRPRSCSSPSTLLASGLLWAARGMLRVVGCLGNVDRAAAETTRESDSSLGAQVQPDGCLRGHAQLIANEGTRDKTSEPLAADFGDHDFLTEGTFQTTQRSTRAEGEADGRPRKQGHPPFCANQIKSNPH